MITNNHYEYPGILCEMFVNVVIPTLCRACENAALQKFGEFGGPYRMQLILETSPFWKDIKHNWYYCGELTVDFSTVMYLCFPPSNTKYENNGVIREISELYGLNEDQKRRILDLRKIRNCLSTNCPIDVDHDAHLEKEAIVMVENALIVFDSSIHSKLQAYRKQLEEAVINRIQ